MKNHSPSRQLKRISLLTVTATVMGCAGPKQPPPSSWSRPTAEPWNTRRRNGRSSIMEIGSSAAQMNSPLAADPHQVRASSRGRGNRLTHRAP